MGEVHSGHVWDRGSSLCCQQYCKWPALLAPKLLNFPCGHFMWPALLALERLGSLFTANWQRCQMLACPEQTLLPGVHERTPGRRRRPRQLADAPHNRSKQSPEYATRVV